MEGYSSQDVSAAVRGDTVYLSGSVFAPGIYEDANEYGLGSPVTLTPVVPDAGLWLAQTAGDERDAMLVSVLETASGAGGHIGGRPDQRPAGPEAARQGGDHHPFVLLGGGDGCVRRLSHRLELVDFDRLTGVLRRRRLDSRVPGS